MLIIKNDQTIQEILQELKTLSVFKDELKILIETLPEALESEIGLDHFIYMLGNYPRQIVWISDNKEVISRLMTRNIHVQKFNSFSSKTDKILEEINRLSENSNQINHENNSQNHIAPIFNLENTFLNPIFGRRETLLNTFEENTVNDLTQIPVTPKLNLEQIKLVSNTETIIGEPKTQEQLPIVANSASSTKKLDLVSLKSISKIENLKNEETNSKKESADVNSSSPNPQTLNKSYQKNNFEKFRSKIIASKEVLESINNPIAKPESIADLITNQLDHIDDLSQNSPKTWSKVTTNNKKPNIFEKSFGLLNPLKYVYILSFSLIGILGFVSITLGFPTVAYTVQINQEKKENQSSFSFDKNILNQQNFKFNLNAKTDTTGTVSTANFRAKGKVRILNKSASNMELVLSKFYLLKDDKRYNPVFDSTQVQTINIPSKNHISGPIVEISVESGNISNGGSNFDLKEDETLIPVNLQGVPLGPNLIAVVSEAISSNSPQTNRTVTDGDLRTLRSTLESNLLSEKQNKIAEIDSKKYISNVNWSTNIESEFNADHKENDPAPDLTMTAKVSSDMYYLDKKLLVDQILARESGADQVTKIEISNAESAWNKDSQKLTLEVKYILALKSDISKDKVKELAKESGLDTNKATSKIKETYPNISNIKASVSGVPVPISPRIEIEVIQNPNLND